MVAQPSVAGMAASAAPGALLWAPLGGSAADHQGHGGSTHLYVHHDGERPRAVLIDAGRTFAGYESRNIEMQFADLRELLTEKVDGEPLVEAIFLTHGHADHIGGLPHLAALGVDLPPVHGSAITLAMLEAEFDQQQIPHSRRPRQVILDPGDPRSIAGMTVTPVPVTHSIGGAYSFALETAAVRHWHSGDVKLDQSALIGPVTDLQALSALGRAGVDSATIDASGATKPGETPREDRVRQSYQDIIAAHPGQRIFIACYGHYQERHADIIAATAAARAGDDPPTVAVIGPSATEALFAMKRAGLDFSAIAGAPVQVREGRSVTLDDPALVVLTSGIHGEAGTPLVDAVLPTGRDQGPRLSLGPGDVVVLSRRFAGRADARDQEWLAALQATGAQIYTGDTHALESSGHGNQHDLEQVLSRVRPATVLPVHSGGRDLDRARDALGRMAAGWGGVAVTVHDRSLRALDRPGAPEIGTIPVRWIDLPAWPADKPGSASLPAAQRAPRRQAAPALP